jgi:hypothetical protein
VVAVEIGHGYGLGKLACGIGDRFTKRPIAIAQKDVCKPAPAIRRGDGYKIDFTVAVQVRRLTLA